MSKYRKPFVTAALTFAVTATLAAGPALAGKFGLGRAATSDEIAAWDKDVSPDGTGLPVGSGSVEVGEEIFAENCAICHGDFAEGVDNWPKLAGGADTLDHEDPLKTVGSYWPYLSTTWDYVNRSMPFGNAQTLDADQVYAIVAYILYSNDMVEDDFVLSNENFLDVEMPNSGGFIIDDRAETELSIFTADNACMTDCKETVEITMRAAVLDVTPGETRAKKVQELIRRTKPKRKIVVEVPTVEEVKTEEPVVAEAPVVEVALDPALVKKGEKVFKKCKACHQVGDKAKNKTGPVLNGIVGAKVGAADKFKYSKPMLALAEGGAIWTEEELASFLTKPKKYLKGTKMSFAGLKKEADIAAVTEYLKSFDQ